ncbi:MAG: Uma2 family endonuclease [Gemmataceae bacterium]|nr:Uma2 family endonuclease [Gemmataceae bacterium]MCI0743739.1 Uma2 family endonuclease [Gemmataceae bacterium]
MTTAQSTRGQRLLLHDVTWEEYDRLLKAFAVRRVRLTYDRGVLEIMTVSHEHESENYFLSRLVDTLTEVLGLEVKGGKSTTFKRRKRQRGLEPDSCWWIQNEVQVRGKKQIDLRVDPPPDLTLEIDISRSSLKRMSIYAALKVPEVWRYDGTDLLFYKLGVHGKYVETNDSVAFPGLKAGDLIPFLQLHSQLGETTVVRQFRAWAEQRFGVKP